MGFDRENPYGESRFIVSDFFDSRDGSADQSAADIRAAIDPALMADPFDMAGLLQNVGIDLRRLRTFSGQIDAVDAAKAATDPGSWQARAARNRVPQATSDLGKYGSMNVLNPVFANTASTLVLDKPNGVRNLLLIQNTGAIVLVINFGGDAGPASGLTLPVGGTWFFDVSVPQDAIYIASSGAGGTAAIGFINAGMPLTGSS